MSDSPSKKQLLDAIEKLEKDGNFGGFLIDIGLGAVGAVGAGAAVATFGTSSLLFGLITVAPPVGLVVGGAAAGALALVGLKKILFDGTFSEGKKSEMIRQFKEQLKDIESKERASNIKESDKKRFIISLKEVVQLNLLDPEKAKKLIDAVNQGKMSISEAIRYIEDLLKNI